MSSLLKSRSRKRPEVDRLTFWIVARRTEGVDDGGEVDGLVLDLDSCGEEEPQVSATESYLRLGLVEQRESVSSLGQER